MKILGVLLLRSLKGAKALVNKTLALLIAQKVKKKTLTKVPTLCLYFTRAGVGTRDLPPEGDRHARTMRKMTVPLLIALIVKTMIKIVTKDLKTCP